MQLQTKSQLNVSFFFVRVALVMVHLHGIGTVTKAEVGTSNWGTDVTVITILKNWGLCIRKAVESFKDCLMDHPRRNMEDSCVDGNLDYELPT